jgi:hypothetical protein
MLTRTLLRFMIPPAEETVLRAEYASARIGKMIRHYAARGLQLLGLIVTGEALLNYFGDMGGLMMVATLGAGLFYLGWAVQPRKGE